MIDTFKNKNHWTKSKISSLTVITIKLSEMLIRASAWLMADVNTPSISLNKSNLLLMSFITPQ